MQYKLFLSDNSSDNGYTQRNTAWLDSYIKVSELNEISNNFEVWRIEESSAALSTLTHGYFRYFGKFPPPVASRFIKEYHDPSIGPVVDPMVGSGTTLVEAILLNREAIGLDVNPLSVLISKVKTTPIPVNKIEQALDKYGSFVLAGGRIRTQSYIPSDKHLDHWFSKEIQEGISKCLWFIDHNLENNDIKDFFSLALAASIRRLSRASNGLGRMFLDPEKPLLKVHEIVAKQVSKMTQGIYELSVLKPRVQVIHQDAKKTFLSKNFTNLVIVHPPYFNLYKYSGIYKFEMLWLGMDIKSTRDEEIKDGFKVGKTELVNQYVEDVSDIFKNIHTVLVPGGICVLMIGDTYIRGERINTTKKTLNKIGNKDFSIEKIIIRQPKFTEATYAATQRRTKEEVGVKLADYLVVLRKK